MLKQVSVLIIQFLKNHGKRCLRGIRISLRKCEKAARNYSERRVIIELDHGGSSLNMPTIASEMTKQKITQERKKRSGRSYVRNITGRMYLRYRPTYGRTFCLAIRFTLLKSSGLICDLLTRPILCRQQGQTSWKSSTPQMRSSIPARISAPHSAQV